jgi:ribosomal protein S27AE
MEIYNVEKYNCPQCTGTLKINHKLAVIDTDPQCEGYSCDKCGHTEWFSEDDIASQEEHPSIKKWKNIIAFN